jgi:hypothetical protein
MLLRKIPVFCLLLGLAFSGRAAAGIALQPPAHPAAWQRAEFRLTDVPVAANNFDPDLIRLDATFTAPSGATFLVPAFWFQDYARTVVDGVESLAPRGAPEWRLRFTPTEAGAYTVAVSVALAGGAPSAPAVSRFVVAPAAPAPRNTWVRVAANRRDLETAGGRALRLIGENVCWPRDRGLGDYEEWFPAMRRSGQNFARLWLAPWWAGLEHAPGTLNHYRLDAAWRLDRVFDLAADNGLYLMLCLDHHGMFMANDPAWGGANNFWPQNPYARENGGPCASPNDFFRNPQAQALYQKRLRYLIARYGDSPQLLAWQFFNEIDNAYIPRSDLVGTDVVAWHRNMGRWLRAHDPYRHLVTTSLTGGSDRADLWALPELDFSMYHSYADPAPGRKVAALSADFLRRYQKPVMIGEFGVSARDWARPADPHLRGFRQALWSAALGGSVGTSMSWWWEDIHDDRAYGLYAALHGILDRAGWTEGEWTAIAFAGAATPPRELAGAAPDDAAFTAAVALNAFRRITLSGEAAIADPLSAARASEFLSGYLRGRSAGEDARPLRLTARFGSDAKVVLHVESVGRSAGLVVRVDGEERLRESFAGVADATSTKVDREFSVAVPAGLHRIEIANTGDDWLSLDALKLVRARHSLFAGGWTHGPEAVGLRRGGRGIVHVTSPWMVFPAGALGFRGPEQTGRTVTLTDWPEGRFRAQWFDPQTGREVAVTEATAAGGRLAVPLPAFDDDLAGIVAPAE